MERSQEILNKTDQRIAAIYAKRSGKPAKEFEQLMRLNDGNGRWLSPEEAVGYGLADRVTESVRISADAVKTVRNLRLPSLPEGYPLNNDHVTVKNVRKLWNALIEFLGWAGTQEIPEKREAVANETPKPEPAVTRQDKTPDAACVPPEVIPDAQSQTIAELQNRIAILEARNARLEAGPTATKTKEDPSPQDTRRSPNEEAYTEDLRRFPATV